MNTTPMTQAPVEPIFPGAPSVAALIDVMTGLTDLLRTENRLLARGMPAALAEMTDRKVALSEDYEALMGEVRQRWAREMAENPELRHTLLRIGRELDSLTRENLRRLEAAMDASRRRIDAVMDAVLAENRRSGTYSREGAPVGGRLVAYRTDYLA